jgi:FkbM family methyltransferase
VNQRAGKVQPDEVSGSLVSSFQRAVQKRRNGQSIERRTETFWGEKIIVVIPEPVSDSIIIAGYADETVTSMILSCVRPGMTVFDIGAHIGFYSLLASQIVGPTGTVHAFEPGRYSYEVLTANVANRPNVSICNSAVHRSVGSLKFRDYGRYYSAFNSFYNPRLSGEEANGLKQTRYSVRTISLDAYIESTGCIPDFVKIDAESSEYYIVEGMRETLQRHRPLFSLEVGDMDLEGIRSSKDLVTLAMSFDYTPIEYRDGMLVPHQIRERYMYDNILFVPKEDLTGWPAAVSLSEVSI